MSRLLCSSILKDSPNGAQYFVQLKGSTENKKKSNQCKNKRQKTKQTKNHACTRCVLNVYSKKKVKQSLVYWSNETFDLYPEAHALGHSGSGRVSL